jgi:hypothetical protein
MKLDTPAKKTAVVLLSLVMLGVAGFLIYKHTHRPPPDYVRQHRALGRRMARELAKVLEKREKKRVLVITAASPDTILRAQTDAFFEAMKEHSDIEIKEVEKVESDGKRRIAAGTGLSTRKFVRLVEKNLKADAIVSFIGVPDTEDPEWDKLTAKVPRFLAETGDRDRVPALLTNRTLRAAFVPRFEFPSPVKDPKSDREWFDKYFQILHPPGSTNAATQTVTNASAAALR